jgi:hypothetical protein
MLRRLRTYRRLVVLLQRAAFLRCVDVDAHVLDARVHEQ